MLFHNTDVGPVVDEQQLVRDAATDAAAWDALYRLYVQRVYHYVRAQVRSEDDAADLTQQIFVQALAALNRSTVVQSFAPWLFRIAHNAIISLRRQQRPTVSWEQIPETRHPTGEPNPEQVVLQQEHLSELYALVAALEPAKQQLLLLRFAAQLSFAEIAKVLGKEPDAVKKQLYRILERLKEHYRHAS
jgi:RNA polymerase sigma-70 factor, ECF subfamily